MPKSRLRILHVNKLFRPDYTGEGIFVERLTPSMDILDKDTQHDVLAVDTTGDSAGYHHCNALRTVYYLGLRNKSSIYSYLLTTLFLIARVARYDVLHFHTHVDRYFVSTFIYKLFGRKVIYTATLNDSAEGLLNGYSPSVRPFVARCIQMFDRYICISRRLYEETVPYIGTSKALLIPIGIHIPAPVEADSAAGRRSLGLDPDRPTLIFVGGICRRKDPLLLINAVAALKRQDMPVSLILVGPVLEPDYEAEIQGEIERNGLHSLIARPGEVDNPNRYFALADIMTFASHSEGFGTVVIEAMAMGLPVIARRLPGVNEDFVLQGKTGFLFDNDEEFLPILQDLLADPSRRKELGRTARAHVSQFYGMERVAESYLTAYGSPVAAAPNAIAERWSADDSAERHRFSTGGALSSPIDARSRAVWTPLPFDQPIVLTTIDGEEEFDWGKPFVRENRSVTNLEHQEAPNRIFARYGVKPTYLVTHPIVEDPGASCLLRSWIDEGLCEVGVQLHPWVTPPFEEEVSTYNSFLGNLDTRLQFYKIKALTEAVEDRFGVRPIAFRAGRYGVGNRIGDILRALGFEVDLSVVPHFDYSDHGGTAFWDTPEMPYWCDRSQRVLEVPLTSGMVGPLGKRDVVTAALFGDTAQRVHLPGVLARLKLVERVRLTPEGTTFDDCKRLVRARVADNKKIFVISYHTPSLIPATRPMCGRRPTSTGS